MDTSEVIQQHTSQEYVRESIKLTKNSKGYTWEIRVVGSKDSAILTDADIKHLQELDTKMQEQYGSTI